MMPHTKYQGSQPYGFRQEAFSMFFPILDYYIRLGQGHFWPNGYNFNKVGRSPLGDTAY